MQHTLINTLTVAGGLYVAGMGVNNWGDSMQAAEAARGRFDVPIPEQIFHFGGDQPEAVMLVVEPNQGPDKSVHEDSLLNAEVDAMLILVGAAATVKGVVDIRR